MLDKFKLFIHWLRISFPLKREFGYCGKNTILLYPLRIYNPQSVFVEENVKLSSGLHILNSPNEKVIIKKYTVFAANCTICPNSHVSTVTVPQFLLGASHVNDVSSDVIIDEDVWLGTGVTILAGVHIGRGCIVGAGSMVTKSLPPYSVAVGSPARILKKKFSIEQIMQHEACLYPNRERFTETFLKELEKSYFVGKEAYGTAEGLDADALARIDRIKNNLHFVEPILDKNE